MRPPNALPAPGRWRAAWPLACVAALAPAAAQAWGFTGHRMVAAAAIEAMRDGPRALFAANAGWVTEHAVDPDLWRAAGDPGEGPNHFLDLDAFGAPPFPDLPRVESAHRARHGAAAVEQGRLPWRVGEIYRDLVAAFRARDEARALERAAVLAHYVGDAHVPLHAVVNYDGQLSGQQGVHGRWESDLVDRFRRQIEPGLARLAPSPAGDPVEDTFTALQESFAEADAVLASDRALAGPRDFVETPEDDRYDDAYYSRLFEREGERVRRRMRLGASRLAGLWTRAWQEAGRPALSASFRYAHVRGQSRAVLLSLDGAAASLIDDAVARGVMPALAGLRAQGAVARGSLPAWPPLTAPSHAALFTGAWSDRSGISGTDVPVRGGTVLDMEDGYGSLPLSAEPLWAAAAREGLSVTVASATQVFPFGPYLDERRFGGNYSRSLTLFDGYRSLRADAAVYTASELPTRPPETWIGPLPAHVAAAREFSIEEWGLRVDGLLYDDPRDPAVGFDTLLLTLDRDAGAGVVLKPLPAGAGTDAFRPLTIRLAGGRATVWFRLFRLSLDGGDMLLYRTAPHVLRASRPRVEDAAYEATGGFVGNGAWSAYEAGELGPPLWAGGDGTAERRYLETVALAARQFARLFDFAHDRTDWHLLITYLPYPDEAAHVWLGRLDPSLPSHDAALAARLHPFFDAMLKIVDEHVGHIRERTGPDVVLAVAADHGLAGADRTFRPNVALAAAGLLALDQSGRADLSRTRAVYFPGNSGFVSLNRAGRPGGIVAAGDEDEVRREVTRVLQDVRDPVTGAPVLAKVLDAREAHEPATGGGDLYLAVAPGVSLSAATRGAVLEPTRPRGEHLGDPSWPALQAAFAIAGPGVRTGADLGPVRQVDVAPTVAALLGIGPPRQAVGHVLEGALAVSAPAPSTDPAGRPRP